MLDESYMATLTDGAVSVWACPAATMCSGSRAVFSSNGELSPDVCTSGFEGICCGRCKEGLALDGGKCKTCWYPAWVTFLVCQVLDLIVCACVHTSVTRRKRALLGVELAAPPEAAGSPSSSVRKGEGAASAKTVGVSQDI